MSIKHVTVVRLVNYLIVTEILAHMNDESIEDDACNVYHLHKNSSKKTLSKV